MSFAKIINGVDCKISVTDSPVIQRHKSSFGIQTSQPEFITEAKRNTICRINE